jgi:hypothetical protein
MRSIADGIADVARKAEIEQDLDALKQWIGGEWTTEGREMFARGFERYLAEGQAPIARLNTVFERFKNWLKDIYHNIVGSDIDVNLTPEVKRIFGEMLGADRPRAADVIRTITEDAKIPTSRAASSIGNTNRIRPIVEKLKDEARLARGSAGVIDRATAGKIDDWLRSLRPKLNETKMVASRVGVMERDHVLLNYGDRRVGDVALSYPFMYSYWPTRTAMHWAGRVVNNPAIVTNYLRYKKAQHKLNEDLPTFWRDQVRINLFNHPLYFNLEQSLLPLYGMVYDFQDRDKGREPLGAALQTMANLGIGALWQPAVLAYAAYLQSQGDKEGALAWSGYLGPVTRAVKAGTAIAREYIPGAQNVIPPGGVVLEPWLWQGGPFQGGDKWERRRAGAAAYDMVKKGQISTETQIDAMYAQTGDVYNQALQNAAMARAFGQMGGYLLGQGFKARNASDIELDRAADEFYDLMQSLNGMTPEQKSAAFDAFYAKYPNYAAVQLNRKNDIARDTAMVWLVLGRLAPGIPGAQDKEAAGIDQKLLDKFYKDSKFEHWTDAQRQEFMQQIVSAGQMWAIPNLPTREQYDRVKAKYKAIRAEQSRQYPDGEAMNDEYKKLKTDAEKDTYLAKHPRLKKYWNFNTEQMMKDPEVFAYYGSPENLKYALNDQVKAAIDAKYPGMAAVNEEFERLGRPKQMYQEYAKLGPYRDELFAAYAVEKNTAAPTGLGVEPVHTGQRPDYYGAGMTTAPVQQRTNAVLGALNPFRGEGPYQQTAAQALAQPQGGGATATGPTTGGGSYIWGAPKTPYEFTFDMPFNPMGAPLSPQQLAEIEEKRKQIEILKQLNWVEPTKTTAGTTTGGATYAPKTGSTASTTTQPATTPPATGSSYVDQILAAASNPIAVTAQYGTYDELTKAITGAAFDARNAQYPDYAAMDAAFKAIPAWDKQARAKFYNDNPRYADAQNYLGNMLDFIKANPINPRPDAATVNAYLSAMSSVGIAPPVQSSYTPMRARGGGGAGGGYGGGGRAGRGTTPARLYGKLFSRMSPALQLALSQYFNSGVALSAEALQSLAGLGITDVEQLRPYFVQTRYSTSSQNATGNNQWWTPTPYRRGPTWRRW